MDDCHPQRKLIAQGSICRVEECSCGVLHVTIGALTIRLHAEVVASVWATLGDAIQHLSVRSVRERGDARREVLPS